MKAAPRKLHLAFLLLSLMLAPHACLGETGLAKELVKIGVIAPLTGGNAYGGEDISRVAGLMQDRLNRRSAKFRYEFLIDDGKCGVGSAAAAIANKLISIDKGRFLIAGCSGETLIAGPIAQRSKALMFSVFSSHKDVRTLGDYIFRTFVDNERSIKRFSLYIKAHEKGPIALLTEEAVFTKNITNILSSELGSQIVFSEEYPLDSTDFATLIAKVRAKGVSAVFLNAASVTSLSALVNQAAGHRFKAQYYSYLYPELHGFAEATGTKSAGLTFLGAPALRSTSQDVAEVLAEFNSRYGKGPNWNLTFAATYDAIQAMTDGIEAVGADPTLVKEFLKTYSKDGSVGRIEFDENGDVRHLNFALKRLEPNGKIVILDSLGVVSNPH